METPAQCAARQLAALEDLGEQTALLLRAREFAEAAATFRRAGPLVEKLAALAPAVPHLRPRVSALLERRQRDLDFLGAALAETQTELRRVDESRGRLRRVAPAYGPGATPVARFNAAA